MQMIPTTLNSLQEESRNMKPLRQVTVSIDSVVFADGSVVVPDRIHFIERSNKEREGERVVLTGAMDRSPKERLAYLTEIVNAPEIPYMSVKDIEYFQRSKRDTAGWLLELQLTNAQALIESHNPTGISAEELIMNSL